MKSIQMNFFCKFSQINNADAKFQQNYFSGVKKINPDTIFQFYLKPATLTYQYGMK